MNTLLNPNQPLTMSSREIAELVEKRHDHVKRTIDALEKKGIIACPQIVDVQEIAGNKRTYATTVYRLEKRDTYIVVARLSPEFTARLVDRWQELESKQTESVMALMPKDYEEALEHLLVEHRARKVAENRLIEQQPKIEKYDQFLDTSAYLNLQNAMRALGVRPNLGIKALRDAGVFFSQGGNDNTPKAEYIQAGYFVVRFSDPVGERIFPQTFVTPTGVNWLAVGIPAHLKVVEGV
jgi:phage regulator Rha-like protein